MSISPECLHSRLREGTRSNNRGRRVTLEAQRGRGLQRAPRQPWAPLRALPACALPRQSILPARPGRSAFQSRPPARAPLWRRCLSGRSRVWQWRHRSGRDPRSRLEAGAGSSVSASASCSAARCRGSFGVAEVVNERNKSLETKRVKTWGRLT
jgi:hypothetical protein